MQRTPEVFERFKEQVRLEGRLVGRLEGQLSLFARRLGRPLTAPEQATVRARLDVLGADRVGDVALDLTPEALTAWLDDPDAPCAVSHVTP